MRTWILCLFQLIPVLSAAMSILTAIPASLNNDLHIKTVRSALLNLGCPSLWNIWAGICLTSLVCVSPGMLAGRLFVEVTGATGCIGLRLSTTDIIATTRQYAQKNRFLLKRLLFVVPAKLMIWAADSSIKVKLIFRWFKRNEILEPQTNADFCSADIRLKRHPARWIV